MNKNKQILGMANVLTKIAEQPIMIDGLEQWSDVIAEELYNAGYRKASEIALKVIGEIEEATENHIKAIGRLEPQNDYCAGGKKALDMTLKVLAKLKNKYTEEK